MFPASWKTSGRVGPWGMPRVQGECWAGLGDFPPNQATSFSCRPQPESFCRDKRRRRARGSREMHGWL